MIQWWNRPAKRVVEHSVWRKLFLWWDLRLSPLDAQFAAIESDLALASRPLILSAIFPEENLPKYSRIYIGKQYHQSSQRTRRGSRENVRIYCTYIIKSKVFWASWWVRSMPWLEATSVISISAALYQHHPVRPRSHHYHTSDRYPPHSLVGYPSLS